MVDDAAVVAEARPEGRAGAAIAACAPADGDPGAMISRGSSQLVDRELWGIERRSSAIWLRRSEVWSGRGYEVLVERLGRGSPAERFPRPAVQRCGDGVERLGAVP